MQKIALLFTVVLWAGCSVSPPAPEEPQGPKRPINAMSTEQRQQLRFVDPATPEKLEKR